MPLIGFPLPSLRKKRSHSGLRKYTISLAQEEMNSYHISTLYRDKLEDNDILWSNPNHQGYLDENDSELEKCLSSPNLDFCSFKDDFDLDVNIEKKSKEIDNLDENFIIVKKENLGARKKATILKCSALNAFGKLLYEDVERSSAWAATEGDNGNCLRSQEIKFKDCDSNTQHTLTNVYRSVSISSLYAHHQHLAHHSNTKDITIDEKQDSYIQPISATVSKSCENILVNCENLINESKDQAEMSTPCLNQMIKFKSAQRLDTLLEENCASCEQSSSTSKLDIKCHNDHRLFARGYINVRNSSSEHDNDSVTSSVQHRSDESGYESDGKAEKCDHNILIEEVSFSNQLNMPSKNKIKLANDNFQKFSHFLQKLKNNSSANSVTKNGMYQLFYLIWSVNYF